jgi:cytoplasmic iron level regulating protein YaaA (DUF328/UPF0246 family)
MLIIISPAKTLDYKTPISIQGETEAPFLRESAKLIKVLKKLNPNDISGLMKVSSKIAYLNHDRFAQWQLPFPAGTTRQALLAFKGEVFNGLDAYSFSQEEMDYAQEHLRMLSGLYGVLRPLDMMMPYRLEMGTKLAQGKNKHLYEFWGDKITKNIQESLNEQKQKVLVNLASNEYYKSVKSSKIKARIITPIFKEAKGDQYKVIAIFAKKARGLMSRYIIKNRIETPEDIKLFNEAGYFYNEILSTENEFIFTRG